MDLSSDQVALCSCDTSIHLQIHSVGNKIRIFFFIKLHPLRFFLQNRFVQYRFPPPPPPIKMARSKLILLKLPNRVNNTRKTNMSTISDLRRVQDGVPSETTYRQQKSLKLGCLVSTWSIFSPLINCCSVLLWIHEPKIFYLLSGQIRISSDKSTARWWEGAGLPGGVCWYRRD